MAVDLHTHSTVSDGSETPATVVALAAEAGLSAVALTDHDILSGLTEARQAADRHGIELVPGVELSLDWSEHVQPPTGGGMHLLVLGIEDVGGPLQDRLSELRRGRDGRNTIILERLHEQGLPLEIAEVEALSGGGSVGRPHIAAAMVARGYVPDIGTAFELYLGNRGPAYVGRPRLTPAGALTLAKASGGVSVLAHPFTLGFEHDAQLEELVEELVDLGLDGLESHHCGVEPERRPVLRRLARRHGLACSGGSDFHGTFKPGIAIGTGTGDLLVPDAFLEELRDRAGL